MIHCCIAGMQPKPPRQQTWASKGLFCLLSPNWFVQSIHFSLPWRWQLRCWGTDGELAGLRGVMFIDPLIDRLITGSSVATRESNTLPLSDEWLVPYFGLPNQMSDSPLCLCHAETNVHAGTSAACANKDLNTEQTAPPSPLCACDHQIIAERGRADLQVWGMGPAFSCWDLPSGLNSTSPPPRVPFFPVIVS